MTGSVAGPIVQARALSHSYGNVVALDAIDLEIDAGLPWAILGPNGAGKSTLLSILAGLIRPSAGTLLIDRIDAIRDPVAASRVIGHASQAIGLYPILTVRENLAAFAGLAGVARRDRDAAARRIAGQLALDTLLDRRVNTLSGGQRRMVHCAAAMVHRPRLVLLDEPSAGLDADASALLLRVVRDAAAAGVAICYATHHLDEVEALGARLIVLDRGQVAISGSVAALVASYTLPVLQLTFDGPVPLMIVEAGGDATIDGSTMRIPCATPAQRLATLLAAMGDGANRLHGVEVLRPGLGAALDQARRSPTHHGASAAHADAHRRTA